MSDLATILAFLPIAALGSFVYGVTGFGAGLFTIPLASHVRDVSFVLAVFALLDTINAGRLSLADPRSIIRDELTRLVPSCVAGVVLGAALVLVLPPSVLMLALGVFVLAYALYSLAASPTVRTVGLGWAYVAGVAGGVASAMFGAGGPPYAIYLSMRPHATQTMRATLAATSLVSIVTRIVAFAVGGLLSSAAVWLTALAVAPASLLALWLADRVHAALPRETVITAMRLLLVLAGLSLVVRGWARG